MDARVEGRFQLLTQGWFQYAYACRWYVSDLLLELEKGVNTASVVTGISSDCFDLKLHQTPICMEMEFQIWNQPGVIHKTRARQEV